MKNLLFLLICCLGFAPALSAQEKTMDAEQKAEMKADREAYKKIIEGEMKSEFRTFAYKAIDLTEEEIVALDPLYMEYMDEKAKLMKKKFALLDEYKAEMKEDDSVEDEREETADFIEDYWEFEIASMELKKDYFDRFEDKIALHKAIDFFVLEEAVENKMKQQRFAQRMPVIIDVYRYDMRNQKNKEKHMHMKDKKDMKHKDHMQKEKMKKGKS